MKTPILSTSLGVVRVALVATCLSWATLPPVQAGGGPLCGNGAMVRSALDQDPKTAESAVATLRLFGQAGVDAVFIVLGKEIAELKEAYARHQPLTQEQERLRAVVDAVSQQHNAFASQLFWHTSLDEAKAAARQRGKPILSLRLLGKLTEEQSCANSRFFRTMLYSNAEISKRLREDFVLHWESVRPVPRVRVDFGDGRTLESTITGNSIHYILDKDGQIIDALPGLYGPGAFLRGLAAAEGAMQKMVNVTGEERMAALRKHHIARLDETLGRWEADLSRVGLASAKAARKDGATPSIEAMMESRAALERATTEEGWRQLSAMHLQDAKLDEPSRTLIAAQHPKAERAAAVAVSKRIVEDPTLRMLRQTEWNASQDGIRNEYVLHTAIHEWIASGKAPATLPEFNEKVYAELFLTPSSDPWLGLSPASVFSGLENDGRRDGGIARVAQP